MPSNRNKDGKEQVKNTKERPEKKRDKIEQMTDRTRREVEKACGG